MKQCVEYDPKSKSDIADFIYKICKKYKVLYHIDDSIILYIPTETNINKKIQDELLTY